MKTKTVGWLIAGTLVAWYLLGSGKALEYTQNIVRMPYEYQYQKYLSEQNPFDRWIIETFHGPKYFNE